MQDFFSGASKQGQAGVGFLLVTLHTDPSLALIHLVTASYPLDAEVKVPTLRYSRCMRQQLLTRMIK